MSSTMNILWVIILILISVFAWFMITGNCKPKVIEDFKGCGGRKGGHRRSYNQWRGRNQAIWWNTPLYYNILPYRYGMNEDPCDCYQKYKNAIQLSLSKDLAERNLVECVEQTLRGGPCL